jgi:hypothetical protein
MISKVSIKFVLEVEYALDSDYYPKGWDAQRALDFELDRAKSTPGEFVDSVVDVDTKLTVTGELLP